MEKDYRDVIRRVFESRDDQNFIECWVGCTADAPDFLAQCRAYRDGDRIKSDEEVQDFLFKVDRSFIKRNTRLREFDVTLPMLRERRNGLLREEAKERLSAYLAEFRHERQREKINEIGFFEQVHAWLEQQQSSAWYRRVAEVLENRREDFTKGAMMLSEALHWNSLDKYLLFLMDNLFNHNQRVVHISVVLMADVGAGAAQQTTDGVRRQLKNLLNGWTQGNPTLRSQTRGALAILGIIQDDAGRHGQPVTFFSGGKEFLKELLEKFEVVEKELLKQMPNKCECMIGQQSLDFFEGV